MQQHQTAEHEQEARETEAPAAAPEDSFFSDKTAQTAQEPGSEDWIEKALTANKVADFVISLAHTSPEQQQRTIDAKERFLLAYELSMGSIGEACKKADIGRRTFYDWKQSDPAFLADVREIDHMRVEMAEDGLMKLMMAGDGPTLRWYLERVTEKYKARKILEHHTDDKTFEDEIDEIIAYMTGQKEPKQQKAHGDNQQHNTEPADEE